MEQEMEKTVYVVIKTFFFCLGVLSLETCRRLGALVGRVAYVCDSRHRRIAFDNLCRAFPGEKSRAEVIEIARGVFENLGKTVFEIGWSLTLRREDFSEYFSLDGLPNLSKAFAKGKGVLLLTGHVGNWELLTIPAAMAGYPSAIVVRPLDFYPLDGFFKELRTRFGAKVIPKKNSMRIVLRSLRKGRMVALLLDQNVDWYDGVFVDFFGRPACTNKGLALLALASGAPVVPFFIERGRSSFRGVFGAEIPLVRTGDKIRDVEANTQEYNKVIETFVRRHPDQWFWVHQRWKTRPYHAWPRQ